MEISKKDPAKIERNAIRSLVTAVANLEFRPSFPAPGTKPLGSERKWGAVTRPSESLRWRLNTTRRRICVEV
jgi:hypothetical protein